MGYSTDWLQDSNYYNALLAQPETVVEEEENSTALATSITAVVCLTAFALWTAKQRKDASNVGDNFNRA